jgi:hypothetical protein
MTPDDQRRSVERTKSTVAFSVAPPAVAVILQQPNDEK